MSTFVILIFATAWFGLMLAWAIWGAIWGHTSTKTQRALWAFAITKSAGILGLVVGYWWTS